MTPGSINLRMLVSRMANRNAGRTEANVQSDLHMLLTTAPLNLDDGDLDTITLESPAGQRRRIDVEIGHTVFEVKKDLRVGNVRAEAVGQLAGYVRSRTCAPSRPSAQTATPKPGPSPLLGPAAGAPSASAARR
jgi:hypothetical protein